MTNLITDYGKALAVDIFKDSVTKYVLLGASTKNDSYLVNLLTNNNEVIKEYNINSENTKLFRYIVTDPKDISDSMVDKDKRLVFTIGISPQDMPSRKFIYAVCLLDDKGNVYSINTFTEPFNQVKDSGQIITIRHIIMSGEQFDQDIKLVSDAEAYVTRQEFVNWANNHTHYDENVSIRTFNDAINKLEYYKVDIGTFGNIKDVNSMDNSSLVNILNEIIASIGTIPKLKTDDQDNLVDALNEVVSLIGNRRDLNFVTVSLVDAINKIFKIVNEIPEPAFSDDVKLKDVSWKEKVDYDFIGNMDDYVGEKKENIVAALNEIRSITRNEAVRIKTPINSTGRYRFYTTNKNNFKYDTYHIKFQPESEEDYLYFIMEVTNTPMLNNSGFDAPTVNFKLVQCTEIHDTVWEWDNSDLDPYGIMIKAGTMGNDRIVEFEFTRHGQLEIWGEVYQVEPYMEFIGEPVEVDNYNDSYINLPLRPYGGDQTFQDIGFLQTLTTPSEMTAKMLFNSGLIDVGYKSAISLQKNIHSMAYKKFGSTLKCNINNRVVRYMGQDAGIEIGATQESGAPNITGEVGVQGPDSNPNYTKGFCYTIFNGHVDGGNSGGSHYINRLGLNNSRISSIYQDNLNEIRVKSTISKGYIKLF